MYTLDELKNMLFVDIETASSHSDWESYTDSLESNSNMGKWWSEKCDFIRKDRADLKDLSDGEMYQSEAALYPEWGRIICISIGQIRVDENENMKFAAKTFYEGDEKQIIEDFNETLKKIFFKIPNIKLVGHNVRGFDIPYICKRSIVNGVAIPRQLHMQKIKPWESCLLDTAEIWKFGGWNGAKLGVICELIGIPSPKEKMEGGEVGREYYKGNIDKIVEYCERDIKATANVMLKMSGLEII